MDLQPKKVRLQSQRPLTCLGDSVILSKMKLLELEEGETYEDLLKQLGPEGPKVREIIARMDASIKKIQEKYKPAIAQAPRK